MQALSRVISLHTDFETINIQLQKVIDQDSKPIVWEPYAWMNEVNESLKDLQRYMKNFGGL